MSNKLHTFFTVFFIALSFYSMAQNEGQQIQKEVTKSGLKEADPVLMEIAGKNIKVSEFEAVYHKNNEKRSREALNEYLDLYVKFRLKVADAEAQGLDTMPKFKKELLGYRKQLAEQYLNDTAVTEALIRQAYDRLQYEVRASHILIKVGAGASPKDTLEAFEKAMKVKKRLEKGEDFAKVAREVDPDARNTGGDLGYFSALYMIYPFESACYNAELNKITGPVRSRFGYHIIKVVDKIPNRGEITVAHIMTRVPSDANPADKESARMKIDEIYQKLENGENFEELAAQFSEDKGSANRGGVLPPFKAGRMVQIFESTAFSLEKDGDYSKPIETDFGYHILKRVSLKKLGTFDEMKPELKYEISRKRRSKKSKVAFINRMKDEYGFKENKKAIDDFYRVIDSSFFHQEWNASMVSDLKKEMFSIGDSTANQTDFAKYLEKNRTIRRPGNIKAYVDRMYHGFKEEYITNYEDVRLEEKYSKFKALMQEYHDGILLFDLMDDKVWSKAVKDSAGLAKFYEEHKNEYMWDERLEAVVYSCANEEIANEVRKLAKSRKKKSLEDQDILSAINVESQLNLELERGKFSKGDNEVIDKIDWKKGFSDNVEQNKRVYFVEVVKVLPSQPKELNEVKGLMTSAYQKSLEEQWIKELESKYTVTIYEENLSLVK